VTVNDPVKPFREIHASDLNSHSLETEMDVQGYLLIRELLPTADLKSLLAEIVQIVAAAGWLEPDYTPLNRLTNPSATCSDSDPAFKRVYEQIFTLESFHAFAHHPVLKCVMNQLVGPQLLIHPKPIVRLIFPNSDRLIPHAHQDHRGIGGDPETFTAWIPLHDCPVELGPLQILEASHRFGLQSNGSENGSLPREIARGRSWVGGPINAGDLLLFHSLTVHSATPNTSNQLRISMDCRFQNYWRALNPATLVFPTSANGSGSWESTYAHWRSHELKYFWKQMPLHFKPSKTELTELAQTADSPETRSRYERILTQIESQIPN
jgi:ectoine hydroxylase-related dioxygenase (phytanoyl-CoA dioxygenase family)